MTKQLDDLITKSAIKFLEKEIDDLVGIEGKGYTKQEAMTDLVSAYSTDGLKDTLYAEAVEIFETIPGIVNIETEIHQPLQRKVLQLLRSKIEEKAK
jgi:hypothetical protein